MGELSQFLSTNKQSFLADLSLNQGEGWTIVMGNEAGDLDSCASALAYSHLSTALDHTRTIALIQTLRADLYLRPENLLAFQFAHLDPLNKDLLTIDDITSCVPLSSLRASFALVDHNTINSQFLTDPSQEDRVKAIFDHHDDEHHYESASPRVVRLPSETGSCTSLITEYFQPRFPPSPSLTPQSAWSDVATLLLSAVVIDTDGLEVKKDAKAQAVDYAAGEFLYPISAFGAPSISGEGTPMTIPELNKELSQTKMDVSKLSGRDLLRRDYKQYNYLTTDSSHVRVGLSTVPMSLDNWLKRDSAAKFWTAQDAWVDERELTVSGVLCSFTKENKHKREILLVFSSNYSDSLEERLCTGLEGEKKKLDLVRHDLDGLVNEKRAKAWKQKKEHTTRKQIEPLIKTIVQNS